MNYLISRHPIALGEWGSAGPSRFSAFEWFWLAVVLGVPAGILALLGALFLGPFAGLVVTAVYALVVAWWLTRAGRAVLAGQAGAQPLQAGEAPRLTNLVQGIAADLGIEPPQVWLTPGPPNAFICSASTPVLVMRKDLVDRYTRTELEAVVAHCLARISAGDLRRASLAAALGALAGPAGVSNLEEADARAVALTLYPPALASAIDKAEPAGTGNHASFWFVPSGSRRPCQAERAERLRDL